MKVIELLDKMLTANIAIKDDNQTLYSGELNDAPYFVLRREIMWVSVNPKSCGLIIRV